MYQRLLLMLAVLCIAGTSMAQNVMTPADGDHIYVVGSSDTLFNPIPASGRIQKWVRDPTQKGRIGWDQSSYKSYRLNNTSFRLRFPDNYDPTKKYPMAIFLHGAGEAASNANPHNTVIVDRENQDQLFWGAQLFAQRVDAGEWNGFLLFPQLLAAPDNAGSQWDDNIFPNVNKIIDSLTKYNSLDADRITVMGLSAGGVGAITYAADHPDRIASVVAASPQLVEALISPPPGTPNPAKKFAEIPIWMTSGGIDAPPSGPVPANAFKSRDSIYLYGTNLRYYYYPKLPHDTWETQWVQLDDQNKFLLSDYWNDAHKAQAIVYFQNTQFCTGQPISAKMGLTPGFYAYEWQMNTGGGFATISGATSNNYTATQAGQFQARFKRAIDSPWSAWSPKPIVITTKACTTDTAFVEHFDQATVTYQATTSGGSNSSYFYQNFDCQNGLFPNGAEFFTHDAAGNSAGRFMLNNTYSAPNVPSCTYASTDQVWHKAANVQTFTDYTLTFYMANQYNNNGGTDSTNNPAAFLRAAINGTVLTPTGGVRASSAGNTSWKKYSYTWNSGNAPNGFADIAIYNNTTNTAWNDFAIDEISLVKFKPTPLPGMALKNFSLWVKANSLSGTNADGTPINIWTNNDINGDNLIQTIQNSAGQNTLPLLKNNPADNINFNPVVSFSSNTGQFLQVNNGFFGANSHTAVTAYIVSKFNTNTQVFKNILIENYSRELSGITHPGTAVTLEGDKISWQAGPDPVANTIMSSANAVEAGKPTVWTFSKDNNGTASGNKQDIRKNGVVIAIGNNVGTITGTNQPFATSNGGQFFDGNIAEIIYVLDSAMTPLKQNRIESYLALKYGNTLGTTASPISYTASDGTTVFWTANAKYQNDVFGIGKDSLSALLQTKSNSANSGSGDGTGQSAKGNLVLSTSTDLLDKRFLVIGNDAGSLSQHVIASGEANALAVGSTRIIRNWKVNNTGAVGAVSISFDTTGLNKQAGVAVNSYALMISNSGDDTYQGTLSFITATGITANKIMFPVVTFANGAVFTLITNNLNVALPAVWLGFTAEAVNGNGVLNWKTSDEINVDRYTVEHSFNGVSFSAIGTVAANNNTGVNNYNYTDAGLAAGNHYYRIRRTDKDGDSEYSDIKTIKIVTAGANVQIRPNPVAGSTLIVGVSVQQSSKTSLQVMAVDGKIMMQQDVNLATGNNIVNINIGSVPPGIYLLRVQLNDGIVIKKFIRER